MIKEQKSKLSRLYLLKVLLLVLQTSFYAQQSPDRKKLNKPCGWECNREIAYTFSDKGNFDSAHYYAEKALTLYPKQVDTAYCDILNQLFEINLNREKYTLCEKYAKIELDARKQIGGENSHRYLVALNNMAFLKFTTEKYSEAIALFNEIISKRKVLFGEKDPFHAIALHNLGDIYKTIGELKQAEEVYTRAIALRENIFGKEHADVIQSMNNLSQVYYMQSNYPASEDLLNKCLSIKLKIFGKEHPSYGLTLNNLAVVRMSMGNFEGAIPLLEESLKLEKKNSSNSANTLSNLAAAYIQIGDHRKSIPIQLRALELQRSIYGKKHYEIATSITALAINYENIQKTDTAELLYKEAESIVLEILGNKHPKYATVLENHASLKLKIKDYSTALGMLREAYSIKAAALGEKHPDVIRNLYNTSALHHTVGRYDSAEVYYKKCLTSSKQDLFRMYSYLSEKEKEAYFKTQEKYYDTFYRFCLPYKSTHPEITGVAYNYILQNKSILLRSSTGLKSAILNSGDTALIRKYNLWNKTKKELTALYATPPEKRKQDPSALELITESLEKDLVKSSQLISNYLSAKNLSWESIKKDLRSGEAAIEFIHFPSGDKITDRYCALILKNNLAYPEMIDLFSSKDFEELMNVSHGENNSYEALYGSKDKLNSNLYKLIWKPIEQHLKGVKHIYLSPSGLLHKISFAAIRNEKGHFIDEKAKIYLTSNSGSGTQDNAQFLNEKTSLVIYGGINYNKSVNPDQQVEVWKYLDGTQTEARNIEHLMHDNHFATEYVHDLLATESHFKQNAGKATILHVSTHGFFFPEPGSVKQGNEASDPSKNSQSSDLKFRGANTGFGVWTFLKNKNPLMRSGLVFAGANSIWNQTYIGTNEEDGVLTAAEVAIMDLKNTQLVVLSACETGLGDIKGSEGVYGLQRAFKMAGVKYMIMSLWQVPDKETAEFMTTFYQKLVKQKNIRAAFHETQKLMRKKYDPYYWAAFTLIE